MTIASLGLDFKVLTGEGSRARSELRVGEVNGAWRGSVFGRVVVFWDDDGREDGCRIATGGGENRGISNGGTCRNVTFFDFRGRKSTDGGDLLFASSNLSMIVLRSGEPPSSTGDWDIRDSCDGARVGELSLLGYELFELERARCERMCVDGCYCKQRVRALDFAIFVDTIRLLFWCIICYYDITNLFSQASSKARKVTRISLHSCW